MRWAWRIWLRALVAGSFVLAVVGYPLLALTIVGILALLVRLETMS